MSWQRRARAGLAVAGLAAAVTVYMLARDREETAPVSLQPADEDVALEGGAGTNTLLEGAIENVRISHSAWKQMKDGSIWYQDPVATFKDDGVEVRAAESILRGGERVGEFGELELLGDVTIITTDGLELVTPHATYTSGTGIATMPREVEIRKGRLTATGVGGFYDRTQELFRLLDAAHLVVAPDVEGGGGIDATATTVTMARQEDFVRLEGQAVIQRPTETLSADVATIYFVEQAEQVRLLDMRGAARVTPAEGVSDAPPAMRGEAISMTFHPATRALQESTLTGQARLVLADEGPARTIDAEWIHLATGQDGRTLTRLEGKQDVVVTLPPADGRPGQTIRAPLLTATGTEPAGLERANFDGGVEYVETAADGASRTGRSRQLALRLVGGFETVDEAEFQEDVRFEADDMTAVAPRAVYRASAEQLELFSGLGRQPHAETGRLAIDAASVVLGLDGADVRAEGDVRTLTQPDPGASDRPTALFSADRPVVGAAAFFEYDEASGRATYRGATNRPARLLQDGSEVSGDVVVVTEESGDLTAEGHVSSVFVLDTENDDGTVSPTAYTIRAERMEYVEASRAATYTGDPVELESGDARSEADTITLTMAEDDREVEFVYWQGRVYALLEGRYEAKGDTLRHEVATGAYRLEGAPAVTKLPAEGRTDCVRSSGLVTIFNRRTGEASWPSALNTRGGQLNQGMPCGGTIR